MSKTFIKYSVVKSFQENYRPQNYLIYAADNRLVYWYLKEPVCSIEPTQCAKLKNMKVDTQIVYIGERDKFYENNEWAKDYDVGSSLVKTIGTLGVYQIIKGNKIQSPQLVAERLNMQCR